MNRIIGDELINSWLSLTHMQMNISNELEIRLQAQHQLSLNEFYLLLFLSEATDKKLKLNQLESMLGLSQSAVSRLVSRFEAKGCGALQRDMCHQDRRSVYTSLTRIGQDKLDQAFITFKEVLVKALPEAQINSLVQTLTRLKPQE